MTWAFNNQFNVHEFMHGKDLVESFITLATAQRQN